MPQKILLKHHEPAEAVREKVIKAPSIIQEREITELSHLLGELEMSQETYDKKVSEKDKATIEAKIHYTKERMKAYLRREWVASPTPKLQENAYKLLGTEQEVRALTGKLEDKKEDTKQGGTQLELILKE